MTIKNFDAFITTLDGQPLIDGEGKEVNITISSQIADILVAPEKEEVLPLKKYELAALALKVKKGGDLDLTTEELATIKEKVGKLGTPTFIYFVFNIIEGI